MNKTVVGIFESEHVAKESIKDLRSAGFEREISLLARNQSSDDSDSENMGGGGTIADGIATGGVLGGLGGLAIGAGALVIPGIGPMIAAGPIAGMLSGVAGGGVAGGLVDWGIPEEEGRRYEEEIKQDNIIVAVNSSESTIDEAEEILRNHGASKVRVHSR